jgi:alpha-L-fucosidase
MRCTISTERTLAALLAAFFGACLLVSNAAGEARAAADARGAGDDLGWFTEARFGMFIHWGPVSLKGTEIGWSRGDQVPTAVYDSLYMRFSPRRFNAAEWVATARAAGMKYLVITSKHHDGFCLWDSDVTDYDIASTGCPQDVLGALSTECRRQGVRFGVYYSICDWHHPYYPTDSPGGRGRKAGADMPAYLSYMYAQLEEILGRYGPVGVLWFDGQWEEPWTSELGEMLYRDLKTIQPDLIINNRVGKRAGAADGQAGAEGDGPGDFDTPEQRIGAFNRSRPWETCMTLCRQWAWKPTDEMKSLAQCVQTLIRTAGGDGNLLLNVGPMPDGRIEPRQAQRLAEMGRWLAEYGEGIYGTRGGPFKPGWWGASTCKDHSIYLFVMVRPENEVLMLPDLGRTITATETLTGGEAVVQQTPDGITISLAEAGEAEVATIIELTVDRIAFEIDPMDVPVPPSGSLAVGRTASASNVFRQMAEYGPQAACDDDPETRWATDAGTQTAWLAVDLGRPMRIGRIVIMEGEWDRVRRFQVQVSDDDDWRTVAEGDRLGPRLEMTIEPVTCRRVRLNILQATEGPTIHEFRLFAE